MCTAIQTALGLKFKEVLESGTQSSDPIFIAAAFLDPVVAHSTKVFNSYPARCTAAVREMVQETS